MTVGVCLTAYIVPTHTPPYAIIVYNEKLIAIAEIYAAKLESMFDASFTAVPIGFAPSFHCWSSTDNQNHAEPKVCQKKKGLDLPECNLTLMSKYDNEAYFAFRIRKLHSSFE
jgi:hypothetical protein